MSESGKNIMIVDDENILVMDVKMMLTELGYTVNMTASSGEEAIEKINKKQPDLILLDIHLKGQMDGIDAAHYIVREWNLPVIFLSAFSDKSTLERVKETSPFGYVLKPFTKQSLKISIEMALYKHDAEKKLRLSEKLIAEEKENLEKKVEQRTAELKKVNYELSRANKLKDSFLANMSHELRTPLNTIQGMSEILLEGIFDKLNSEQYRCINSIKESGKHLLSLINDILDISKIEAGKLELNIGPVSIKAICESSLRLVRQLAVKKKIRIKTKYENENDLVFIDELRVKQVLVNLLGNAVKFTNENGEIGLDVYEEDGMFCIVVWDSGIGIDSVEQENIFKPFVQLDSGLSRKNEGTGLGLALALKLVKLHDGNIFIESFKGKGSRFKIVFPIKSICAEIVHEDVNEIENKYINYDPQNNSEKNILLVDDNTENINMIFPYLRKNNFKVDVAFNGQDAVDEVNKAKPDIVLMDIQMPQMNGIDAIKIIRKKYSNKELPIIAVSALAMVNDRDMAVEAGADDFISKPYSPRDLICKIQEHLYAASLEKGLKIN